MVTVEPGRRLDIGVTWKAIFLGLVVGLVAQFVLTLLGVAIGLSALDVAGQGTNAKGVGLGAGLWALVVPILAWFLGAFAAAWASGVFSRAAGVLQGIATWGLGLVTVLFLIGSGVTGAISSSFGAIGQSAQAIGQSGVVKRGDVARGAEEMQQRAEQKLGQLGPADAQAATEAAAKGAWVAFAAAVLSLGAAVLGGASGARRIARRIEVERREDRTRPTPPLVTRTT
jgi:hypothetical protein